MSVLFKFLLFFFITLWLISRLARFAVRIFLGRAAKQAGERGYTYQRTYHTQQKKSSPRDGNVNIDYVPKESKSMQDNFKGGDYVDYEEVK